MEQPARQGEKTTLQSGSSKAQPERSKEHASPSGNDTQPPAPTVTKGFLSGLIFKHKAAVIRNSKDVHSQDTQLQDAHQQATQLQDSHPKEAPQKEAARPQDAHKQAAHPKDAHPQDVHTQDGLPQNAPLKAATRSQEELQKKDAHSQNALQKNGSSESSVQKSQEYTEPVTDAITRMERTTLQLSFICYAGFWQSKPALIYNNVRDILAKIFPHHELVWGPSIHIPKGVIPKPKVSDAFALITRDTITGDYFIAFRGTNALSMAEVIFQDFMVLGMVPWTSIQQGQAPCDAMISDATRKAIEIRLALRPDSSLPGSKLTLAEQLMAIAGKASARNPVNMYFTGISLGGLLSAVMPLWLHDHVEATHGPQALEGLNINIWSYAAPTPGNRSFARYLDSKLPCYRRYANHLDIVTHAWESSALEELPHLYEPDIRMNKPLASLISLVTSWVHDKHYTQAGTLIPVQSKVVKVPGNLYTIEASRQHLMPYLDLLPADVFKTIIEKMIEPLTNLTSSKRLKRIMLNRALDFVAPGKSLEP